MSMDLYPLTFRPIFRDYIWGGRRLGEVLGKPIGDGPRYAESWEVVDHATASSEVEAGPLAGRTLHELMGSHGRELLGPRLGSSRAFPLLLKYLDCNRVLSVQVHPDDAYAAKLTPPDLGKTEAWYVIDAEPGSVIYAGLAEGIDREGLATAIHANRLREVLHTIEAKAGQCIFIPAGTLHALGAGILVAEIQQSSDTTFRVYDWDRLDDSGHPRPLHIDPALAVTNYMAGPVTPQTPTPIAGGGQRLVECDKFFLDQYSGLQPVTVGNSDYFHLLTVVDGGGTVAWDGDTIRLPRGKTVLVPAVCGSVEFTPYSDGATLLVMGPGQTKKA